jgi:hypothetical protein
MVCYAKAEWGEWLMSSIPVYRDIDLLTWIGERSYPTVESFIQEAQLLGCSRRLPGLIPWAVPHKTRVFLVHRDNNPDESYGSLFGFFVLHSVHIVYDDVTCGRRVKRAYPQLRPGTKSPRTLEEFEEYIVKRKITFVRRQDVTEDVDEIVKELAKEWIKKAIKELGESQLNNGIRRIPQSIEPDIPERLCGSDEWSGRHPGAYIVDALSDWVLDKILDRLLDDPLPDKYFWEDPVKRTRRKHQRAEMGSSRSGRVSIGEVYRQYGTPSQKIARITVFEEPYPLYFHPPKASFRGFQRIDGDSLLLKIGLPQYLAW